MQFSVVVTVLNEVKTINWLLVALANQTKKANEIIFVDAQSQDDTLQLIKAFAQRNPQLNIKCFVKAGNRSVGRNFAIKKAHHDWIAITDAGCIPHDDWLAELTGVKADEKTVVAGFYDAKSSSAFEAAVVPYVLVMPNRVEAQHFLPATRSMLIHRSVWQKLGGFDENLAVSEDYQFAKKLARDPAYKIVFAPRALVTWLPRKSLGEFYRMAVTMAESDALGQVMRFKSWLVLARYGLFVILTLLLINFNFHDPSLATLLIGGWLMLIGGYYLWSISKNYQYAPLGWYWLPILQLTADMAVIMGSLSGLIKLYEKKD